MTVDLSKHERIAFQFSGGKDSLAALYLLRAHWDRFTVYWTDSGNAAPEVREFVERIAKLVPRFEVIKGRQPEQVAEFGWPSDIVPADSTVAGALTLGHTLILQDRNQCCYTSLMKPMHDRMVADGITLIIRGQKLSDKRKSPLRSGHTQDGITLWFPIEDWTDEQVWGYLRAEGIDPPEYYSQGLSVSMDCLTCTAYLDESRQKFLRERHPEAWKTVHHRLLVIQAVSREAQGYLDNFLKESGNGA